MFIRTQIPSGRGGFAKKQRGESRGGIRATTPEKDSRRHRTLSLSLSGLQRSRQSLGFVEEISPQTVKKRQFLLLHKKDLACDLMYYILLLLS